MTIEDVKDAVGIIESALGKQYARKAAKEIPESMMGSDARYVYVERFVAKIDGKVAGVCGLYRWKGHPESFLGIGWFAVNPKFQDMGVGTALICHAEKCAKRDAEYLFVWSTKDAEHFYRRLGFRKGRMQILPKEGDTLLVKKLR